MSKFTSKDLSILSIVERRIKQSFERTDDYKEQIKHIVEAYLKETELEAYLNNLKDVTITSPSNNDQLFYQDGEWVNSKLVGGQAITVSGKTISANLHTQSQPGVISHLDQDIYGTKRFRENLYGYKDLIIQNNNQNPQTINDYSSVGSSLYGNHAVGYQWQQPVGQGFKVDHLGVGDFRMLFIDELIAKGFTVDVAQALAGSDILGKSVSTLAETFVVPPKNSNTATIIVDDLPGFPAFRVFEDGDWIRIKVIERNVDPLENDGFGLAIADLWGTVTFDSSYNEGDFENGFNKEEGTQAWKFTVDYTITRELWGDIGLKVHKGAILLDYGKSGDSYIERTVLDRSPTGTLTHTPYDRIVRWTAPAGKGPGHPEANHEVLTQRGNLLSIGHLGLSQPTYGAYFKDNIFIDVTGGGIAIGKNAIGKHSPQTSTADGISMSGIYGSEIKDTLYISRNSMPPEVHQYSSKSYPDIALRRGGNTTIEVETGYPSPMPYSIFTFTYDVSIDISVSGNIDPFLQSYPLTINIYGKYSGYDQLFLLESKSYQAFKSNLVGEAIYANVRTFDEIVVSILKNPASFFDSDSKVDITSISGHFSNTTISLNNLGLFIRVGGNKILPLSGGFSGGGGGGGGPVSWINILDKPFSSVGHNLTVSNDELRTVNNPTFSGRLTLNSGTLGNHLQLERGDLIYNISPSTGTSGGGVAGELAFRTISGNSRYYFDGPVSAAGYNVGPNTVISNSRDAFLNNIEALDLDVRDIIANNLDVNDISSNNIDAGGTLTVDKVTTLYDSLTIDTGNIHIKLRGDSDVDLSVHANEFRIGLPSVNPLRITSDSGIRIFSSTDLDLGTLTNPINNIYTKGTLSTDNWASRTIGWGINYAGHGDFRSLFADSLVVKAFTADIAQAFRGSRFLSKSFATLEDTFIIPDVGQSSTLIVKDVEGFMGMNVFEKDDFILLPIINTDNGGLIVGEAWGEITSAITDNGDGTQSFTFTTRHLSVSELSGLPANKGSEALSFGSAANPIGFIHETVLDAAGSPYSQTVQWSNNPWDRSNWTVILRSGVLDGLAGISGVGVYTERFYGTKSILIGSLDKTASYLEFNNNKLGLVADELDVTIGSNNKIVANSSGVNIASTAFDLTSGKLKILGSGTNSYIKLGDLTGVDPNTANRGFYVNNSGEILAKAGTTANTHYIRLLQNAITIRGGAGSTLGFGATSQTAGKGTWISGDGNQFRVGTHNATRFLWTGTNLEFFNSSNQKVASFGEDNELYDLKLAGVLNVGLVRIGTDATSPVPDNIASYDTSFSFNEQNPIEFDKSSNKFNSSRGLVPLSPLEVTYNITHSAMSDITYNATIYLYGNKTGQTSTVLGVRSYVSTNGSNLSGKFVVNSGEFDDFHVRLFISSMGDGWGDGVSATITVQLNFSQYTPSISISSRGIYTRLTPSVETPLIPENVSISGGGGTSTWDTLLDKPFVTIGSGLTVQSNQLRTSLSNLTNGTGVASFTYDGLSTATISTVSATASRAGHVTTGSQTFAGEKIFQGLVSVPNATSGSHALNRTTGDGRYLLKSNNLSDLNNSVTAQSNLGLRNSTADLDLNSLEVGSGFSVDESGDVVGRDAKFRNLDVDSIYDRTTNLGRTGGLPLSISDRWLGTEATPEDWQAIPIGTRIMVRNSVGTSHGAPVNNYGYFEKFANRDSPSGWAGLWLPHGNSNQFYIGYSDNASNYATWQRVALNNRPVDFTSIDIGGTLTINSSRDIFARDIFVEGNVQVGNLLHINSTATRFEVWDQIGEKAVMGYLNNIPKNDGSGNWGSNDYGFWVKEGDKMIIDGDLLYENGDWLIENDATLMIVDGITANRIIALGTQNGRKGLFLYDGGGDADSNVQVELTLAGLKAINGFDFTAGTDYWRTSDNSFRFGGGMLTGNSSSLRLAGDNGWYFNNGNMWGGNSAIGNSNTRIVIGISTPKIALGGTANSQTLTSGTGIFMSGVSNGQFRAGSSSKYIRWTGSEFLIVSPTLAIDSASNGTIKLGNNVSSITETSGTGIYLAGNGRFRVGNPSGQYARFDGTDFYWVGNKASLTKAGKFTAEDATITGSITSTSFNLGNGLLTDHSSTVLRLAGSNGWYVNNGNMWAGNSSIGNSGTRFVINLSTTAANNSIKLGASANGLSMTSGTGFYADGAGNVKLGSPTKYLKWNGSTLSTSGIEIRDTSDNLMLSASGSTQVSMHLGTQLLFRAPDDIVQGWIQGTNNGMLIGNGGFPTRFDGDVVFDDEVYYKGQTLDTRFGGGGSVAWEQITGKPSTFPPSSHNHSASQITSGTLSYDRLPFTSNNVSNWNQAYSWGNHALANYAQIGTGSTQVRNNGQLDARYAMASHTHTWGSITGKPTNLFWEQTSTSMRFESPNSLGLTATGGIHFRRANASAGNGAIYFRSDYNGTDTEVARVFVDGRFRGANFLLTSDRRAKSNITRITNALDVVRSLRPSEYIKNERWGSGYITDEIPDRIEYLITKDEEGGYDTLDVNGITAWNTAAIQELDLYVKDEVTLLKERIVKLEAEVKTLRRVE